MGGEGSSADPERQGLGPEQGRAKRSVGRGGGALKGVL